MEIKHKKETTVEEYYPRLDTNTILVKISYALEDVKVMVRFVYGNSINGRIKNYTTFSNDANIKTIIDTAKHHTSNYAHEVVNKDTFNQLEEIFKNILKIDGVPRDYILYGNKAEPKYYINFYNLHKIPDKLLNSIPYKEIHNGIAVFDLKNRINPLIEKIKKHLRHSTILVTGECNLCVINNTSIHDIVKGYDMYESPNLIRYLKIRALDKGRGTVIIEDSILSYAEYKTKIGSTKTNEYYGKSITKTKNNVYGVFKRYTIVNTDNKVKGLIDMEFTYYTHKKIDGEAMLRNIAAFMDNYILRFFLRKDDYKYLCDGNVNKTMNIISKGR